MASCSIWAKFTSLLNDPWGGGAVGFATAPPLVKPGVGKHFFVSGFHFEERFGFGVFENRIKKTPEWNTPEGWGGGQW